MHRKYADRMWRKMKDEDIYKYFEKLGNNVLEGTSGKYLQKPIDQKIFVRLRKLKVTTK